MAEVTLVEAPAKPSGPSIPSGKGEIKVNPGGGTSEIKPVVPGSARERLLNRLAKEGGVDVATIAPQRQPAPVKTVGEKPSTEQTPENPIKPLAKPEGVKPEEKVAPGQEQKKPEDNKGEKPTETKPEVSEKEGEISDDELAQKAADKTQKTNPWKLLKKVKEDLKKAQAEHEATRKLITDEPARKAEVDRLTKAEARAKELEDHIRYVDYSKSNEFTEKYVTPYENAWKTAMDELGGLSHTSEESGEDHRFTEHDMLELVRLPLPQARALAESKWGEYANDVMAQRKEIRGLYDAQHRALTEARTKGAEREAQTRAEAERVSAEVSKSVTGLWKQHSDAMIADEKVGAYLKPVEGDDDLNKRLNTGFEMVDKVFALNPMDPKLSPAQREEIVRGHVALRYRAAAFGAMRLRDERNTAKIAALEKELAQYRGSTPDTGGSKPGGETPTQGDNLRSRLEARFSKVAR